MMFNKIIDQLTKEGWRLLYVGYGFIFFIPLLL